MNSVQANAITVQGVRCKGTFGWTYEYMKAHSLAMFVSNVSTLAAGTHPDYSDYM